MSGLSVKANFTVDPETGACTYYNGVLVGHVYQETDGYYVITFTTRGGCWYEGELIQIATLLHEMNLPWDQQVQRDLVCAHEGHDYTVKVPTASRMYVCSRCGEPGWEMPAECGDGVCVCGGCVL